MGTESGTGSGDPPPLGAELGVQFSPPIWFGDEGGGGCMEAGAGTGMLKPTPLPCLNFGEQCHLRSRCLE